MGFSNKTFQYFDQAKKNKNNLKWFEKNRILYQESVRKPFAHLVELMQKELQRDLPRIEISPRSITRPLRPKNRAERGGGLVKDFSHLSLAEKRSSLFEWNPGIYIQLGADQDHSLVGLGLYMVSSRQLSLLRNAVTEDFEEIDALLNDRKLKKAWGSIQGEKYKRFPKGFNPEDARCKYIWYKQFYLSRNLTRAELKSKSFEKNLVRDLKLALPFIHWVRKTVGTYKGKGSLKA